jgi:hypothetical protein
VKEASTVAVTLENRLRQMQVFNLIHDPYCRGRECSCSEVTVVVTDENPRTGERAPRRVPRKVPTALTLLAREVRKGLPDVVLRVPDVRAAIDRVAAALQFQGQIGPDEARAARDQDTPHQPRPRRRCASSS